MRHFLIFLWLLAMLFTIGTLFAAGNRALAFNGNSNSYVDAGTPSGMSSMTTITVEAWIKPSSFSTNYWENVIAEKGGDSAHGFSLRCGGGGILDFMASWASPGWDSVSATSASGALTTGVWQHVAGTYDGTTARAYVNGVEVASGTSLNKTIDCSRALNIGRSAPFSTRLFRGDIDEFRVWNVARSQVQIQENMLLELPAQSNLILYYRMNEGTGSTLYDSSTTAHNATKFAEAVWTNGYVWEPAYDYPTGIPTNTIIGSEEVTITVTAGSGLNNSAAGTLPAINNQSVSYSSLWLSGSGVQSLSIVTAKTWGAAYYGGSWHQSQRSELLGTITFSNVDFDAKGNVPIILGDEDPTLPVELSSFTGFATSEGNASLAWITQSETNVLGYYILRSETPNLVNAFGVSPLISAANLSTEQRYSFTDNEVLPGIWYYWLEVSEFAGSNSFHGPVTVSISEGENPGTPNIPLSFGLINVSPNPFNPNAKISYNIKAAGTVEMQIFNQRGQLLRTFHNSHAVPGLYYQYWDGKDFAGNDQSSGIYLCRLKADKDSSLIKMMLLK